MHIISGVKRAVYFYHCLSYWIIGVQYEEQSGALNVLRVRLWMSSRNCRTWQRSLMQAQRDSEAIKCRIWDSTAKERIALQSSGVTKWISTVDLQELGVVLLIILWPLANPRA
ncbi:hypothetical protein J3E72DRAFT_272918 [Bipolaris maydis]|nr:hypothetical protein J3E72DRAFT_272918 [Bipolaris maydis]